MYFFASRFKQDEDVISSPLSFKAPLGFSKDNLAYSKMVRHSSQHPSLFYEDGIIKENERVRRSYWRSRFNLSWSSSKFTWRY